MRCVRLAECANSSFAALQGPVPYIKHLVSPTRIPFTTAYFGSLGLTLYFAVGVSPPSLPSCFPFSPRPPFPRRHDSLPLPHPWNAS
jgi:Got1/Sft2-like family